MAEWRECVFGGVELAGFDRRELRQCLVGGLTEQGHWGKVARFEATPDTCADCPVPALVEALKKARPVLASCVRFIRDGIPEPEATRLTAKAPEVIALGQVAAALALLDKAKDGEAHCPDCGQSRDGCSCGWEARNESG